MACPGHLRAHKLAGVEKQEIRFAEADGRRVAWASSGKGPPLVLGGWWMSSLELSWRQPRYRDFVEALGRQRTVIRYDAPTSDTYTVDEAAAALAAVIEAAEMPAVDLFAGSSGAPAGIAFAAAHPERVGTLVIYGGYASGSAIAGERDRAAIVELVREHWGLGSRVLADLFMPSADREEREAFVAYQREAATAEAAAGSLAAVYGFDVAARLGAVTAPAVVLHRRDDRAIPFALGRELAAALPQARLVELEGADHYPWFGDSEAVLRAALRALGVEEAAAIPPAPGTGRTPDSDPAPTEDQDLTSRETEVLTLVASGLSDREIAERLVLSPHTVHRHVANVRTKLGLPTRAAAVAAASRRGLL
jgi:pimeloyl-ACP methyl ester carboxylesterase/DNA-binding CsgD family transcriptional regulator